MKTFELQAPDGRLLRQNHETRPDAAHLITGYKVTGEVFGADAKGNGGMVDHFDAAPLMAVLLDGRNGAFLDEWVAKRLAVHAEASVVRTNITVDATRVAESCCSALAGKTAKGKAA